MWDEEQASSPLPSRSLRHRRRTGPGRSEIHLCAPHVASTLRLTTLQKNEDVTVSSPPVELSVRDGDCPSATFRDLDPNAWYHESIDFVLNAGLMNGMGPPQSSPPMES